MPDMQWRVRVSNATKQWVWIYSFSRTGGVTWRDPGVNMSGKGNWRIDGSKMITTWVNSKTTEAWDVPFKPQGTTGRCYMQGQDLPLVADAVDYYLDEGEVVYTGDKLIRTAVSATIVYSDHVRTGGTIAWICKNPGNIKQSPFTDGHGAYKGAMLRVPGVYGGFAIFPSEQTGLNAIISLLKGWGPISILQAMRKYAPPVEGNNPDLYAKNVAAKLRVSVNTLLSSLTPQQWSQMAAAITGVETTTPGRQMLRNDPRLPPEIRERWVLRA
jgi:hypothetical protein